MDFQTFKDSLSGETPPAGLSEALQALWYEGNNDWPAAHELLQEQGNPESDWVHAYLHRKEGDQANAGYWYRRAGKPMSSRSLAEEWAEIVRALL